MADHPSGTVTFLFTDIEGSTRLWERYPEVMPVMLAAHDAALRRCIEAEHGAVVKSTGDGVLAAFASASDGVAAALAAQRTLRIQEPSAVDAPRIRVRMGLHSGEAEARDGDYFGGALNRAARLMAIGHGGQVLLSEAACALVRAHLPAGVSLVDMGEQRLKDLTLPERVYQVNAPGLPHDFPALNSLSAYRHNLPLQLTSFVGRDTELADVKRLLNDIRLLTLIGPGGTGKTRLSLQAAADLLDQFPEGVWLVELAPVTDPAQVEQAIANVFGVYEQPGASLAQALADYVRSKQLLLVLDNCEHLIGAAAQVASRLLQAGPRLRIISSSREGLAIAGETLYQVPSLGLPPAGLDPQGFANPAGLATQYESVRLFVERARATAPSFALTAENAAAVAEICRRLDGIPLAIELAAARTRLLTPIQMAMRLREHFRVLAGGSRTALPRQQTLQALIDWSWNLLGEPERALLRRLSVFSGWTLEAAEAVCTSEVHRSVDGNQSSVASSQTNLTTGYWLLSIEDVLDTLGQLVNKSLVVAQPQGDESRYRLLETIRQYGRDKLAAAGESAAVHERHARTYARLAAEYEPHMSGPEMSLWLAKFDRDAGNFGAAHEWLLESDPLGALQLACVSAFALMRLGRFAECDQRLSDSIARVRMLPAPGEPAQRSALAEGLIHRAWARWLRGDIRSGTEEMREAVALARSSGDQPTLAAALRAVALSTMVQGNYETGVAEMREAEDIGQAAGQPRDVWGITPLARALQAQILAQRGVDAAAVNALLREAMRMAEAQGSPYVLGLAAYFGRRAAAVLGDLPAERALIDRAIVSFEQAGDVYFSRAMTAELGHYLRRAGQRAEARVMYRQSIHWFQALGNRGAVAHHFECYAMLALADGAPQTAARLFGAAENLRAQAGALMVPDEQADYAAAQARLRAALEPATLERTWAAGRALTLDQAVALALEEAHD